MDKNKLQVLRGIGYEVKGCCGLCQHADLAQDLWGTCKRFGYEHQKHSDSAREVSIHAYGSCPDFTVDLARSGALRRFINLVEGSASP